IPPECNPQTGEVEEGAIDGEQMFMTNQQSAELAQPRVGSLDDPAALVPPQLASVFIPSTLVIFPIGHNQFDATLLQALTKRIRVISPVSNHALRLLSRTTLGPWHADFAERSAKPLPLPPAATAANRWRVKETPPARNAKPHQFAESTKYPLNTPGSPPTVGPACPGAASVQEIKVQSTPTAHRLTVSVVGS